MPWSRRRPAAPLLALLLLAVLASSTPAAAAAPRAPVVPCRVLAAYPHDAAAFTEGLVMEKGRLFTSSGGWGTSFVAETDPVRGKRLATRAVDPDRFAEGLAAAGGNLYLLTWRSGSGFILDPDGLRITGTFAYRAPDAHTEGWGLAFDGSRFILSAGTDTLSFHQAEDFSPTGTIRVHDGDRPVSRLNELEYVEGVVLANIWKQDRIAVIDPADGRVTAWIDLSPLRRRLGPGAGVANGIAYDRDAGRLFVTGKHWDKLFEIAPDLDAWQGPAPGE